VKKIILVLIVLSFLSCEKQNGDIIDIQNLRIINGAGYVEYNHTYYPNEHNPSGESRKYYYLNDAAYLLENESRWRKVREEYYQIYYEKAIRTNENPDWLIDRWISEAEGN
jgi:hypothetical protein